MSFQEILRKKVTADLSNPETKEAIKLESPEDILKFDKNEILVKLEKGEGTLKIEKVAIKKESSEEREEKKTENKVELTIVKSEENPETETKQETETISNEINKENEDEPSEQIKEEDVKTEKESKEDIDTVEDKEKEVKEKLKENPEEPNENVKNTPKTPTESETDLCSKQAAELKAMFPDLEVIQPSQRINQVDSLVLRDKHLDFSENTVANLLNNTVKWPKEYAIQVRLQHIIYAMETKEWPASKSFSAYASGIGNEYDIPIHELPNEPPKRDSSTPMSSVGDSEVITITTDNFSRNALKKRKRHIAIDVETERAKLHALLNSSHGLQNPLSKQLSPWDNDDSEDSRRSTPVSQQMLQPPPAHQQTTRHTSIPFDLKYHVPPKTIGQTTVIPGTNSTLTPIDLSSG